MRAIRLGTCTLQILHMFVKAYILSVNVFPLKLMHDRCTILETVFHLIIHLLTLAIYLMQNDKLRYLSTKSFITSKNIAWNNKQLLPDLLVDGADYHPSKGIISLGRCPREIIHSRGDNLHHPPTSQAIS